MRWFAFYCSQQSFIIRVFDSIQLLWFSNVLSECTDGCVNCGDRTSMGVWNEAWFPAPWQFSVSWCGKGLCEENKFTLYNNHQSVIMALS